MYRDCTGDLKYNNPAIYIQVKGVNALTAEEILGCKVFFWPDCKAIPAYGLMVSVCLSVCLSVRLSTFWLTFAFKFVVGHINQYRLDTLHGNRPW